MKCCATVTNLMTFTVKGKALSGVTHRLSSEGSPIIVHVGFVVDTVALKYVFPCQLSFPQSPILINHLRLLQ
jgi:hypothetical protein